MQDEAVARHLAGADGGHYAIEAEPGPGRFLPGHGLIEFENDFAIIRSVVSRIFEVGCAKHLIWREAMTVLFHQRTGQSGDLGIAIQVKMA